MSAPMCRLAALAAVFLISAASSASAYNGCDKYRFGSQDWWFCMSDKDGER